MQSPGGCISLISSGASAEDSQFMDADDSGDNVFFTTEASLLPQDPGLVDVYDATSTAASRRRPRHRLVKGKPVKARL